MFHWVTLIISRWPPTSPLFMEVSSKTTLTTTSDQIITGSPWGAGTFAGADGSRQPSQLELDVATIQGEAFYKFLKRVSF